jgi:hypothetical protein
MKTRLGMLVVLGAAFVLVAAAVPADKPAALPKAFIDGTGLGWKQLGADDFVNVNCDKDTWTWKKDGSLHCTGRPIGVCRTQKQYTNFELVAEWNHRKRAGNSGIFVWTPEEALKGLKPNRLPSGIEVQILDHGYAEEYEKSTKKKATWFTTQGDVFPVGKSKMKPFPPTSPDGSRSFPRKNRTLGFGQWNHYYVRAINGEIRLWINGEEVSGGNHIEPRTGYVCLESEGSPIDFRNIRIRELP